MEWKVIHCLVEDDMVDLAKRLLQEAEERGVKMILPIDILVADDFKNDANTKVVQATPEEGVPENWMGLDCGPLTKAKITEELADCKTIIWNGPMGVFEMSTFATGTLAIAQALADLTKQGCITIVGGGDSVAAINQMNMASEVSHVSTGGGATLELLGGDLLPGVLAIQEGS